MLNKNKKKAHFKSSLLRRFLFFGRNSGIHGLRHVFKSNGNLITRIFWLLVLIASSACLQRVLVSVVDRDGQVSFTPDTRYLHWTTVFPAVTVCEAYNPKMTQRKFAELYPDLIHTLSFDFKKYLTDLLFAKGVCSKSICVPCGSEIPCDVPWRDIIENVHKSCQEIVIECTFNTKKFDCCKKFRKVDSEYGTCYAFNSYQSKDSRERAMYVVNRTTGPGLLTFNVISDVQVSVHNVEELSTNHLDKKSKFDVKISQENYVDYLFSIVEVENDPMLQEEDLNIRGCRYPHEVPTASLHRYPVYSHGACRLASETEKSFEQCNCVHPVRDLSYKPKYCNYTGLNCLVNYEVQKLKLDLEIDENDGECLPSCVESELTTIHISRRWEHENQPGKGTTINIRMSSLPTLRYHRNLLNTHLDLVVSFGGMVGLFFSASILSLVEIFYLILRSPV